MNLYVLASGSAANGYVLADSANEAIVLECGCKPSALWEAGINARVMAAFASHEHADHSKYADAYMNYGIPVYSTNNVVKKRHFGHVLRSAVRYECGRFSVAAFALKHDVECFGFLIDHAEMGRLTFITDTMYCEYCLPDVNHWLVECNYADDILDKNIANGSVHAAMRQRLMGTHMGLEACKTLLKTNDLTFTQNIVLLHMSDNNSDERRFVGEIRAATGKPTFAACKGMVLKL
jgi:phosphoribosyl 1,2-cyclic phosphodiesterase